jgi:hypothetical protein
MRKEEQAPLKPTASQKHKGQRKHSLSLTILIALALLGIIASSTTVWASGIYGSARGYDISYPQCQRAYPRAPYGFALVGVNGGKAFTRNPCLAAQFAWARGASNAAPALYMNINSPGGASAKYGNNGPMGACAKNDAGCQAYNYGFNAAQDAFRYATAQGATSANWWLDVETTNSWSPDTSLNAQVVQGAIEFWIGQRVTIGVYSTASQWDKITGGFVPNTGAQSNLPLWVAGANRLMAPAYCVGGGSFGGGAVSLVQYANGEYMSDYAC